jgi:hypothetical protein
MRTLTITLIICGLSAWWINAETQREFAILTPDNCRILQERVADLSLPRWKPDSSLVLVDKAGDVPFSAAEIVLLDSLGAVRISQQDINNYLAVNGWNYE